ncbi:MAG TPA: lysophospholipid acyltransferase family protein [Terriglobales bacterium]|nr:lysophospholipid acyltransferase family protein [Terriglobales bacterium]
MRTILMLAWWSIGVVLDALWAFPWTLITGKVDAMYRSAMWIALTGVRIAGVRWKVIGYDQLDLSRNYIFMSNHVSNLDPPLLIPLLPHRVTIMVKKELFRLPILGRAMRMADCVPIDRHNREAAISSVREAEAVVRKGHHIVVYPEGTRSRDGRLLPFKKGPFYMAMETGVPIVPITLLGSETLWPKGKFFVKPGEVTVVFHPAVDPKQFSDRDQLITAVRNSIASALPPERRG